MIYLAILIAISVTLVTLVLKLTDEDTLEDNMKSIRNYREIGPNTPFISIVVTRDKEIVKYTHPSKQEFLQSFSIGVGEMYESISEWLELSEYITYVGVAETKKQLLKVGEDLKMSGELLSKYLKEVKGE